jgi:hypothetical protein
MSLTSEPEAQSLPFLGMAPFLRMSIAGVDFSSMTQEMIALAEKAPEDATLWMNLAIAMMSLKHEESGLQIQNQALQMQRVYHWHARQPTKLRVLLLMVPGNLSANIPLDCLLEDSDIDLIHYYVDPGAPHPLTSLCRSTIWSWWPSAPATSKLPFYSAWKTYFTTGRSRF